MLFGLSQMRAGGDISTESKGAAAGAADCTDAPFKNNPILG